jgi:hypothetical protein
VPLSLTVTVTVFTCRCCQRRQAGADLGDGVVVDVTGLGPRIAVVSPRFSTRKAISPAIAVRSRLITRAVTFAGARSRLDRCLRKKGKQQPITQIADPLGGHGIEDGAAVEDLLDLLGQQHRWPARTPVAVYSPGVGSVSQPRAVSRFSFDRNDFTVERSAASSPGPAATCAHRRPRPASVSTSRMSR